MELKQNIKYFFYILIMNWEIKKIKNKNSNYDFRLIPSKKNDYSEINFFKTSYFRQLISISSYLTDGIIKSKNIFYKIKTKSNRPVIFDFYLEKTSKNKNFSTIDKDDNISVSMFGINYKIKSIIKPDTRIFSSMFETKNIVDINNFFKDNKTIYKHINKSENNLYIVTGESNNSNIILDLMSDKNRLTRYKIKNFDIDYIKNGYHLFMFSFNKYMEPQLVFNIPIIFDEYITYIYDLMLPYKFDFNDIGHNKNMKDTVDYKNKGIMKMAFAIDPDGSKDRDDAIASFFIDKNNNDKIVDNIYKATHIKLLVHISNTLPYIIPRDDNYYYHFSKYKCNTDYLDKTNLPMMDRILSEKMLSLEGTDKEAITIEMEYTIKDKKNLVIYPFPENVSIHKSKNLEIIGTTYTKFAESFDKKPKKGFRNNDFSKRYIINCNKTVRDYNQFIFEGDCTLSNNKKRNLANNLKQLYIFFVNSLNHTGKDSLIKVPNGMVRDNDNVYLDFKPVDMWAHSLVEYTALESNIYFAHMMYMISKKNKKSDCGIYNFNYEDIISNIEHLGNKNINMLIKNLNTDKKIKSKPIGIFRNLFAPSLNTETYINKKIGKMMISKKSNDQIIEKLLKKYKYPQIKQKNSNNLLKLLLALRQMHLLINSKTNIDISSKLISPELKMKARYESFPFWHIDISTFFYTHATSPMRRFVDINVHHFIFNPEYKSYIMRNTDFDGINLSVQAGKSIHHLVNNIRFNEFIKQNNPTLTFIPIDNGRSRKGTIYGFKEIINFYNFNKTHVKSNTKVNIIFDDYMIPKFIKSKDNPFNLHKYMILREHKNIRYLISPFLEKILKTKYIKNVCN